jgi:hypothetical protein
LEPDKPAVPHVGRIFEQASRPIRQFSAGEIRAKPAINRSSSNLHRSESGPWATAQFEKS